MSTSSLFNIKTVLQHAQKDDVAFLAFVLAASAVYTIYFKDRKDPFQHVWYEKPQADDIQGKAAETRDIGLKLEQSNKDLVIFWGSQSGTAEGFANRLARDCRSRFGLDALSADLSDYDPETIGSIAQNKIAVFIISTYGEGDPSDNTAHFLSWLESNKLDQNQHSQFIKLRYAAFGLGNRKYKFYNRVIDVAVEALDHFGAKALMPTGKADDAEGSTEEDFAAWKQNLFEIFRSQLGYTERPEQYEPTLNVVEDVSLDIIDLHAGEPIQPAAGKKGAAAISPIQPLPIKVAKKLLSTQERNCLHVEVDTSSFPTLKYKTGDHLAVWPSNPTSEIQRLVNVLGLHGKTQTPLLISSLDPTVQVKVPSPSSWDALLQYYLEICAPVARETVLALAGFAPSPSSKAILKQLGEDKDTYHDFCSKNHVNLGRLLEHVSGPGDSWSKLPLSFVLESLPTLSPRYYSISSSSIVSPKQIAITVATSTETALGRTAPIPGLTTDYLLALEQKLQGAGSEPAYNLSGPNNTLVHGSKLYAHVRTSKFRLPTLPKHPIIMIASGSGIAPFRGFLAERARLASIGGRDVGRSLLFFGCRSSEELLYKEELDALQASNAEIGVVSALSRTETNARGAKNYVQDRVEENDEEVIRLLTQENAYFYICGSASMARDVAGRLGECMRRKLGWGEAELREWSESMRKTHRWQEDVWG